MPGHGAQEVVTDLELQYFLADMNIAMFTGAMTPNTDLLPGHAHHAYRGDFPRNPAWVRALRDGRDLTPREWLIPLLRGYLYLTTDEDDPGNLGV